MERRRADHQTSTHEAVLSANGAQSGAALLESAVVNGLGAEQLDAAARAALGRRAGASGGDLHAAQDAWTEIRRALCAAHPELRDCISALKLVGRDRHAVTLQAPTNASAAGVRQAALAALESAWRAASGDISAVRIVVDPVSFAARFDDSPRGRPAAGAARRRDDAAHAQSFDAIQIGDANRAAYAAARALSEAAPTAGGERRRTLVVIGQPGAGKTHLLQALAGRRRDLFGPSAALLAPADGPLARLAPAVEAMLASADPLRRGGGAAVLVSDDIGGPDRPMAETAALLSRLAATHGAHLALGVRAASADAAGPAEEALRAGLTPDVEAETLVHAVLAPERALRAAILSAAARAAAPRLGVDPAALELLADRLKLHPGPLLAAYRALVAEADRAGRRAGLPFAQDLLARGQLSAAPAPEEPLAEDARPTPSAVLDAVSKQYGVRPADITGASTAPDALLARRVAIYLLDRLTDEPLERIGARLGGRDESRLRVARDWVMAARQRDGLLARTLDALRHQLLRAARRHAKVGA